jgi:5'-nucleotidase
MSSPLILITNDDGVHAPGIDALARALFDLGEVYVVAPDRERSACSHGLTIHNPLHAQRLGDRRFAVDGTPADCISVGLMRLVPRRPALVVSGINRGANLGDDIFYSGTVGGAREAVFQGIPAVATSLVTRSDDDDFEPAAAVTVRIAEMVLRNGLPRRTLLNVNVPPGAPVGIAVTNQGIREHEGFVSEGLDPRSQPYFWIQETHNSWANDEDSDIAAVRRGLVSVTPIQTDMTHRGIMDNLSLLTSRLGIR